MEKTPLVSVCCITYNHAPYISQCVDGFLMQKTSFPFEIIINDDCSNDGTTEILKDYAIKYPDLIHLILHDENQYSKGIRRILATFVYPVAKGKYIAICEGDDYWTDPYKLQKQVDYLESHPECGLVYTNSMIYDQEKQHLFKASLPKQSDFRGLLLESPIMTLTTCYRKELYKRYYEEIERKPTWLMGDLPLWLFLAAQGPIKYLSDITSVYRILKSSASHSGDINKSIKFCMSSYDIRKYYANKYHSQNLIKQICIMHANELFSLAVNNDRNLSGYIAKMCFKESVFSPRIWLKIILYSIPLGRKYHKIKYE